jgi:hypothetical protein
LGKPHRSEGAWRRLHMTRRSLDFWWSIRTTTSSEGGKLWDRTRRVAEANDCAPHMLQVLNAARQAKLRVFFQRRRNFARWRSPIHPDGSVDWLAAFRANARRSGSISTASSCICDGISSVFLAESVRVQGPLVNPSRPKKTVTSVICGLVARLRAGGWQISHAVRKTDTSFCVAAGRTLPRAQAAL